MKIPTADPSGRQLAPAEVVRSLPCGLCGLAPGAPCSAKGDHLARWLGAYSARAITREQLTVVVVGLVVVTKWCLVTEEAAG